MKFAVFIPSAINTKFGVYDSDKRLAQTVQTIQSVKNRIPGVAIFLAEMAGLPLQEQQRSVLLEHVNNIIDFTADPAVVDLYNSTDNWDVVKNVTEILCTRKTIQTLKDTGAAQSYDRFFKISGRYLMSDDFDINYYHDYKVKNCIVISTPRTSQFPVSITGVERQYMCRLWSWPGLLTSEIIEVYDRSLQYMLERLQQGGYADIEHCLYKFLDHGKIIEKSPIGVQGNISPNGAEVRD